MNKKGCFPSAAAREMEHLSGRASFYLSRFHPSLLSPVQSYEKNYSETYLVVHFPKILICYILQKILTFAASIRFYPYFFLEAILLFGAFSIFRNYLLRNYVIRRRRCDRGREKMRGWNNRERGKVSSDPNKSYCQLLAFLFLSPFSSLSLPSSASLLGVNTTPTA